jgi:hypothetical protein
MGYMVGIWWVYGYMGYMGYMVGYMGLVLWGSCDWDVKLTRDSFTFHLFNARWSAGKKDLHRRSCFVQSSAIAI